VVHPSIRESASGKIEVPRESYTIKIGGSRRIYTLLSSPDLFHALPLGFCKCFLDVLHLVMIRSSYDVIRFQCHGMEDQTSQTEGLTRILLKLIKYIQQQETGRWENHPSTKRIIHLLGLSSSAGISTTDLRDFLMLLREPSDVSLSLLQALKTMIRHDNAIVKAAPASFFNLGGEGAGLVSEKAAFPFSKEYQFCTWFRVEKFATTGAEVQHVVSVLNDAGYGIDVFLRDRLLHISMAFTKGAEAQVLGALRGICRRETHAPAWKQALADRLETQQQQAAVARVVRQAAVQVVQRLAVALEHLQETTAVEDQHAGDVAPLVVAAGLGEQRRHLVGVQRFGRFACVDQSGKHLASVGWPQAGRGAAGKW
jgi:hypothetical protein